MYNSIGRNKLCPIDFCLNMIQLYSRRTSITIRDSAYRAQYPICTFAAKELIKNRIALRRRESGRRTTFQSKQECGQEKEHKRSCNGDSVFITSTLLSCNVKKKSPVLKKEARSYTEYAMKSDTLINLFN